jgi:rhamnogalacturonan endolyase
MAGNLSGDPQAPPRVCASASDLDYKILNHVRVGHNQSPSVGKYRTDLPGLQYVSVNYWKNPGIVTSFDSKRRGSGAG